MKIIQVCSRYYPEIGGIETHVKELSEALVKRGHDVEVVCTSSHKLPEKDIINGVKVTRLRAFAPGEAYFFSPAMYFYLKGQDCDVVHAHNYHSFPVLFAALARKKKFIFTPHTFGFSKSLIRKTLHKFYRPFGDYIFRSAHRIISTAKFEEKWLIETFKIPETKIVYIPLPINISNKNYHKERAASIKKIAYFGRLSKEKNIKVLILAFKLLKETHQDIGLFIAGDGPARKDLEYLGKNVGNVNFLGRLSEIDLKKFLEDIDIFVLPSMFEVSPRSVIEAMSLGIPVVTTPVGELPQVFRDGKDCLFAKIDDPQDMAEKILWLMNNEKQAKDIALSGRSIVEKRYDINNVISDYIQIYKD